MIGDQQTKKMLNALLVVVILVSAYLFWQRFNNKVIDQSESPYTQVYEEAVNSIDPIENEEDLDGVLELLDDINVEAIGGDLDSLDKEMSDF